MNCMAAKMQVNDWSLEWSTAVVIAFDGEEVAATTALGGANDGLVG